MYGLTAACAYVLCGLSAACACVLCGLTAACACVLCDSTSWAKTDLRAGASTSTQTLQQNLAGLRAGFQPTRISTGQDVLDYYAFTISARLLHPEACLHVHS